MEKLDVWGLIKNNAFNEACEKADIEYENTKSVFVLRNKIYALLHLKKYNEVISLAESLIEIRKGETDSDFIALGIAYWATSSVNEAIAAWTQAQFSLYKDAAGGIDIQVYLYYSAIKTGKEELKGSSIKQIKKILKSKKAFNWPGPLGNYLLDNITEAQLSSFIVNISPLRERQLCQLNFVSAIKFLEMGNLSEYYEKLKICLSFGASAYLEYMYYLAMIELDKI